MSQQVEDQPFEVFRAVGEEPVILEPTSEHAAGESRRGGKYKAIRSTGYRAHSHYTPTDLEDRARNAWYWTQLEEKGFNTKSELVTAGMQLMCELLEELYNHGEPFKAAPEDIRRGPSPAGAARQSAAMKDWWSQRSDNWTPAPPKWARRIRWSKGATTTTDPRHLLGSESRYPAVRQDQPV